ncbi:hypothetical protein AKJ51_00775 [candidate division MSBL1 archaeon SCGC-AAA382A20]|uniref:Uncharacterized protein n=1 Tax=candidate division MSBL1 archaeon SCGC-AAA382A20 TaxID=1698280 RepID=A0A133VME1_9EURY|nr:hypothetical protein AKJ51_00775 [candidate division MSBL1 archaeon SCGC-AAA382A20]
MEPENQKKLKEIIWDLNSQEELDEVHNLVRQRWDHLVKQEVTSYKPSDRVKWLHKGRSHTGKVVKCNVKTVDVEEDNSDKIWRITPTNLERI